MLWMPSFRREQKQKNKTTRRVQVTTRTYPAGPRWPTGYAMDAQFLERTKTKEQKHNGGSS